MLVTHYYKSQADIRGESKGSGVSIDKNKQEKRMRKPNDDLITAFKRDNIDSWKHRGVGVDSVLHRGM